MLQEILYALILLLSDHGNRYRAGPRHRRVYGPVSPEALRRTAAASHRALPGGGLRASCERLPEPARRAGRGPIKRTRRRLYYYKKNDKIPMDN